MTMILAKLSTGLPGLPAGDGAQLPNEVQWMPPGEHEIRATQGGKAVTHRVRVTAATAARLNEQLQGARNRAAQGREDLPFIDFNHEDREAAGFVQGFRWGGDDPGSGGVRASIEWTGPGRAALEGRAFRRFSPSFYVDAAGEVTGAPLNMGGLVNKAAFKTITPIVASGSSGTASDANERSSGMDPEKLAADLAAANKTIAELQAKLGSTASDQTIKAKEAEVLSLQTQVAALTAKLGEQAKANAKAVVDAAVKEGKLAPQATELHAKWTEAIAANPGLAETLQLLKADSLLAGTVVHGKAGDAAGGTPGGTEAVKAKARDEAVQAYRAAHECDHSEAWNAVRRSQPGLFGLAQ